MLLIKNQLCKSGQKDFVKVEKACKDTDCVVRPSTSLTYEKMEDICELIWSDRHLTVQYKTF